MSTARRRVPPDVVRRLLQRMSGWSCLMLCSARAAYPIILRWRRECGASRLDPHEYFADGRIPDQLSLQPRSSGRESCLQVDMRDASTQVAESGLLPCLYRAQPACAAVGTREGRTCCCQPTRMTAASAAASCKVKMPSGPRMRAAAAVAVCCQASPVWEAMASRSIATNEATDPIRRSAVQSAPLTPRGGAWGVTPDCVRWTCWMISMSEELRLRLNSSAACCACCPTLWTAADDPIKLHPYSAFEN